jgi:hypothetical protein
MIPCTRPQGIYQGKESEEYEQRNDEFPHIFLNEGTEAIDRVIVFI